MLEELLNETYVLDNDSRHILCQLGPSAEYTVFRFEPKKNLDKHGFSDKNHMLYWAWESPEFKYIDSVAIIAASKITPFSKIYTVDHTDSWPLTTPFKIVNYDEEDTAQQYTCEAKLTNDGLCIKFPYTDPDLVKEAYISLCKNIDDGAVGIYLLVKGKREELIGDESINKMLEGRLVYHGQTANQMIIEERDYLPGIYSFDIPIDMLFIKYRTAFIVSADVVFNNRLPVYIHTDNRDGLLFAVVNGKLKVYQPFTSLGMTITNFGDKK